MRHRCAAMVWGILWCCAAPAHAQDPMLPPATEDSADVEDLHGSLTAPDPFAQTPPPKPPPSAYPNEEPRGRTARNMLFVELGGAGIFDSVNYGRIVGEGWLLRVGVGGMVLPGARAGTAGTLAVPVSLSFVGVRWGSHALELGLAGTLRYAAFAVDGPIVHDDGAEMRLLAEGHVGYCYAPTGGGFGWRAGLALLVGPGLGLSLDVADRVGAVPWAYASVGWVF